MHLEEFFYCLFAVTLLNVYFVSQELKKEAKKVVKHVVNAKLNKKHKKHKGGAGNLNGQTLMTGFAILISMALAQF